MTTIVVLVALAAMALVGLDLALRPEHHVRTSADRVESNRPYPLEALSHRLLPKLENARAYRWIGIAIIVLSALFAAAALTEFSGAL